MSALSLTKNYGDLTLLMVSDIHGMWTELETKANGNIADDNVASGWANWSMVTLSKDVAYTMGTTDSGVLLFISATNEFVIGHTGSNSYFVNVGGSERMESTAGSCEVPYDVYFYNSSTTYPLSYLLQYQKPVLVYADENTLNIEQNTTTANRTIIVFPSGPVAVTEDVTSTHKFRQLKLDATANGYTTGHSGAADSGLRSGLTLAENTWYFTYAAVVQSGTDSGTDNFVLVVDDTSPKESNWGTLNSRYGTGMWVYVGLFRVGHGLASEDIIVPFVQDHQGWHTFTGRGSTDDFFGIKVASSTISSTSVGTVVTLAVADSGNGAPDTCSALKLTTRPVGSGADMVGTMYITDASDNVLWDMPAFGINLSLPEAHGFEIKLPNVGLKLKAETGTAS